MTPSLTSAASSATLSIVITRADGTVENLGIVSRWYKNPLKRLAWSCYKFLKGI